jgi:hypothetical protein
VVTIWLRPHLLPSGTRLGQNNNTTTMRCVFSIWHFPSSPLPPFYNLIMAVLPI